MPPSKKIHQNQNLLTTFSVILWTDRQMDKQRQKITSLAELTILLLQVEDVKGDLGIEML